MKKYIRQHNEKITIYIDVPYHLNIGDVILNKYFGQFKDIADVYITEQIIFITIHENSDILFNTVKIAIDAILKNLTK